MVEYVEQFREVLEEAGLVPNEIVADGSLHRCACDYKPYGKDGAYILHNDGYVAGWWRNWRTGKSDTWVAEGQKKMTQQERKDFKEHVARAKKKQQEEAAKRNRMRTETACALFDGGNEITGHPYADMKGIDIPEGCRTINKDKAGRIAGVLFGVDSRTGQPKEWERLGESILLVPISNEAGEITAIQGIGVNGDKANYGPMPCPMFVIPGDQEKPIYLVEGVATGVSVQMATGAEVIVCFNAGGLGKVAPAIRRKHHKREIVVAGDNDWATEEKGQGNPGVEAAKAAAEAVGGKWVVPQLGDLLLGTDFNDLHQVKGIDSVREQLAQPKTEIKGRLPYGFSLRPKGVHFSVEDSAGNISYEWLCSPLKIIAHTRDDQGNNWGRLLEFENLDGVVQRWAMPMAMTAGDGKEYRTHLLSMGLRVASGTKFRNRLHDYITQVDTDARALCVDHSGWQDGVFVLPSGTIGHRRGEEVVYQGIPEEDLFKVSGGLEEWQEQIGRYCIGNSRFAFAVSIAFAGPLLDPLHVESGGFHFVGGSSGGKTTMAEVAGSVCGGGGVHGFKRQWRITDNALEGQALAHNDTLLVLDEISQAEPKVVSRSAYMLANGQGKGRANVTGGTRKVSQWRIVFISTGEETLADYLWRDRLKINAGQAMRLPDIPSDAGCGMKSLEVLHGFDDGAALANHFKTACKDFYGSPFQAYLKRLVGGKGEAIESVKTTMKEFCKARLPFGADSQIGRVRDRFALVAGAGELAIKYGILPWAKGEAVRAAQACFSAWIGQRGGIESQELQEGLAQIRRFFQAHSLSRFENIDAEQEEKVINCVGEKKRVDGVLEYRVFPEQFKSEIAQGRDLNLALHHLRDHGILLCNDGKLQKNVRVKGKSRKMYVFTDEVVAGETGNTGIAGNEVESVEERTVPLEGNSQGTEGNVCCGRSPRDLASVNRGNVGKANEYGFVPPVTLTGYDAPERNEDGVASHPDEVTI